MKALRLAVVAACCAAPFAASAQWMWLDAQGVKVFSDRAPPPDIAPNRILKQPGARTPSPEAAPAGDPAAATPPAAAPQLAGKDRALEEKKKQASAAEAEKRKAEEERVAKARADNCKRAQARKAELTSGVRLVRLNERGEREILDDAHKAEEVRFADVVIRRDCKDATGPQ